MANELDKWMRHGTVLGRNLHPAWAYLETAREYLEAGRTLHLHPMPKKDVRWLVDDVPEDWKFYELQFPLLFCLAHASELLFKAFLSAHGKGKETPGWRNHAIGVLCQSCLNLGLVITDNTRSFIDDLASENDDFTYRFGERTTPIFFPPTKSALQAVDELERSVTPPVEPFIGTKGGGLL
ncbi:hypothetical protein [Bradyrhizobium sp. URHD0069]|uniref:hypothetical protein n=1 Tax=Bradyrhizobium sp. URHD0069 TaxID=1380355 RepID=UPI0004971EF1|nr:hypothetical protein [Bradyrhizobium sp. URHD0069]